MSIKLAIVGYRDFHDYETLCNHVNEWRKEIEMDKKITHIISGGASGVDKLAEKYAKDNNINIIIHYPDWKKYGKNAGPLRNKLIVNDATHLIAFVHENSKGTVNCYNYAIEKELITKKIMI